MSKHSDKAKNFRTFSETQMGAAYTWFPSSKIAILFQYPGIFSRTIL